jgi:hypothetical protein
VVILPAAEELNAVEDPDILAAICMEPERIPPPADAKYPESLLSWEILLPDTITFFQVAIYVIF